MSKQTKLNYPILDEEGGSVYWSKGMPESACIVDSLSGVLLIPLQEEVFFPYLHVSTLITNNKIAEELKRLYQSKGWGLFLTQPENFPDSLDKVKPSDLNGFIGVLGRVANIEEIPMKGLMIEIDLSHQGVIKKLTRRKSLLYASVDVLMLELIMPSSDELQNGNKLEEIYSRLKKYLNQNDNEQLSKLLNQLPENSVRRLSFMIQNSPLHVDQRYSLLLETSLSQRRNFLISMLEEEIENLKIRSEIGNKAMSELGQRQREEFLRQQLQQIRNELGEGEDSEFEELKERALNKKWTTETEKKFEKEMRRLSRFNPNTPDYAVQYTYIDTFLSLPWLKFDSADFSLDKVEEILNRDHFGMEKVKERIIEQMAVMKLRKDTKSPIICLYGPPGVGKTSLGKSIAEATGRKYVRVALGGLHDEAEIRGHRKTYLGSMPGRIIHAIEQAGTSDPVMVLDEIDKIGNDYKGDPQQALLEVLDPEQNCKFRDNYLDHEYDLSKVLFIATANSLQGLSSPLLDRMELIEIPGYVINEKIEIAKRHLIPRDLTELGFEENEVSFSDEAIRNIINSYTRESGVRKLEKRICEVLRKLARQKASGKEFPTLVEADMLNEYLGKPDTFNNDGVDSENIGIVTGLAWTQVGGEILFIESSVAPGKEEKLVLTGNLGDVMKESAMIALQYIKANYEKIGIPESALKFGTLHIHVPEGAVPKDGPSAGVSLLTSIASTFSGRKVKSHLAMTGEITLRGKVLPVGGIREKILAAKRAGVKDIILCEKNQKDIQEINPEYLFGLNFHYVNSVDEVLDFALV